MYIIIIGLNKNLFEIIIIIVLHLLQPTSLPPMGLKNREKKKKKKEKQKEKRKKERNEEAEKERKKKKKKTKQKKTENLFSV